MDVRRTRGDPVNFGKAVCGLQRSMPNGVASLSCSCLRNVMEPFEGAVNGVLFLKEPKAGD